jgi:hypothetical protein
MSRATSPQQIKIGLGDHLRAMIDHMAEENGRSVAEEIRARLLLSFQLEEDPVTLALLHEIKVLAQMVQAAAGKDWHSDQRAQAIFAAAASDQIRSYAIDGQSPRQETDVDLTGEPDTDMGHAIARSLRGLWNDESNPNLKLHYEQIKQLRAAQK